MNILVMGDVMLDINYISLVKRNAPEANIPIHNITNIEYLLGGAANVANNLHKLNTNVELISIIGNDEFGKKIKEMCDLQNINNKLFIDNRKTTQKNRIFNNSELKVRYDIEDTHDISHELCNDIFNYVINKKNIDAIIISDYDKGCISEELCQLIIEYSNNNNIYTFIDPKIKNYKKYKGSFCFKPNLNESISISNTSNLNDIFNFIKNNIECTHILITCSENGMYLNDMHTHIKHEEKNICLDVTGAGDIVLSVLVYCFIRYGDMLLASKISNYIGGKSISSIGNYVTSINEIEFYYNKCKTNIIYESEIDRLVQFQNKNTVFTNGCFDIIHSAHLELFKFCKKLGGMVVVGLNSDNSIRRLKGPTRPIFKLEDRIKMLEALEYIDFIIPFEEDTPLELLKVLKPHYLVKGGDYTKESIIGKEYANEVLLFNYIDGKSTTNTIATIQSIYKLQSKD
jgi:D-beta-D-heptose 7-phosphate kinase/D-beta-D-heptose 1-phosphate adenosyltransferase